MLLKRVLGASEAPFRAYTQYIHTCKLPSSIGGFRSNKSTIVRYGTLASELRSNHVKSVQICVSSISAKQKAG